MSAPDTSGPARGRVTRTARATALLVAAVAMLMIASAGPASAAELRSGDAIDVAADEIINDDLYAAGSSVRIQGTVNGNVFAAGQTVIVDGIVKGTVFAAAQSVTVNGDVGASVLAAGQTVLVDGPVGRDLGMAGASVTLTEAGAVEGDVGATGSQVRVDGPVGKRARLAGGDVSIGGPIERGVWAQSDKLRVGPAAMIGGDLIYVSDKQADIAPTAKIDGKTTRRAPKTTEVEEEGLAARVLARLIGWARSLVGWAVFALIVLGLFTGFGTRAADTVASKPLPSLGLGLAVLVVSPVVGITVFILGLLVGGAWIGLFALSVWTIAIAVGYVVAATFFGGWLLGLVGAKNAHPAVGALVGVLIVSLVGLVPMLGGLVWLAAMLFGLGAATLTVVGRAASAPKTGEAPPEAPAAPTPPAAPA